MKLIRHTYSYSIKWILFILVIGSVFCFLMIEYINLEEADEFLTYEMQRLVAYHSANGDLPEGTQIFADLASVVDTLVKRI